MMTKTDHDLNPSVRRRDFLVAGAGVALLPSGSWWPGEGSCEHLAVGYCQDTPPDIGGIAAPGPVVAATRLAYGDPQLARGGVRVTVHGVEGEADRLRRQGISAADLWVRFDVAGASPVEYLAWSYRATPVENVGSPNRFTVPVDSGLTLALELGDKRFETRLTTGRVPGLAKLRAGRYLIAPGAKTFPSGWYDSARAESFIALSVEPLDDRSS